MRIVLTGLGRYGRHTANLSHPLIPHGLTGAGEPLGRPMTDLFGPVPSRRLGASLGINTIPPKTCSYGCVYCQLGNTIAMTLERREYVDPDHLKVAVEERIAALEERGERVDYLTFVPDGEPTLDLKLEEEISVLAPVGIPIAVITNGSLVGDPAVREALGLADWVSLKVDSVNEKVWRAIDRPYGRLNLEEILKGMETFAADFNGTLVSETMLVAGLNDGEKETMATRDFIARLNVQTAYLTIPTRPPAEPWVHPPDEARIVAIWHLYREKIGRVEMITGDEGEAFTGAGGVTADELLAITAVHPMRRGAVETFIEKNGATWSLVEDLLEKGLLIETSYGGSTFYIRRFL